MNWLINNDDKDDADDNATTTMMAGAAHPLECERLWGPVPLSSETGEPLPPATAAEPCSDEGCGPAYMQVCFVLSVCWS